MVCFLYPPLLDVVHLEGKESRSFEGTESYIPDLKLFFLKTLLDWLSAKRNPSLFSGVDLLDLCNFFVIDCLL